MDRHSDLRGRGPATAAAARNADLEAPPPAQDPSQPALALARDRRRLPSLKTVLKLGAGATMLYFGRGVLTRTAIDSLPGDIDSPAFLPVKVMEEAMSNVEEAIGARIDTALLPTIASDEPAPAVIHLPGTVPVFATAAEAGLDATAVGPGTMAADSNATIANATTSNVTTAAPTEGARPAAPPESVERTVQALVDAGVRNFLVVGTKDYEPDQLEVVTSLLESIAGHGGENVTFHLYGGKPSEPNWEKEVNVSHWEGRVRTKKMEAQPGFLHIDDLVHSAGYDVAAVKIEDALGSYSPVGADGNRWHSVLPGTAPEEGHAGDVRLVDLRSRNAYLRSLETEPSAVLVFDHDLAKKNIDRRKMLKFLAKRGSSVVEFDVPGHGKLTFIARMPDAKPMRELAARTPGLKFVEGEAWKPQRPDVLATSDPRMRSHALAERVGKYRAAGIQKAILGEAHGSRFNMEATARIMQGLRTPGKRLHLYQELWTGERIEGGHIAMVDNIMTMHRANIRDFHRREPDAVEEDLFFQAAEHEDGLVVHPMRFRNMLHRDLNAFVETEEDPALAWMGMSHALGKVVLENVVDESWKGESAHGVEPVPEYRVGADLTGAQRLAADQAERDLYDGLRRTLAKTPGTMLVFNSENFSTAELERLRRHIRKLNQEMRARGEPGLETRTERFDGGDGNGYTVDFVTTPDIQAKVDAMDQQDQQIRRASVNLSGVA